jgi:hypothetical protein
MLESFFAQQPAAAAFPTQPKGVAFAPPATTASSIIPSSSSALSASPKLSSTSPLKSPIKKSSSISRSSRTLRSDKQATEAQNQSTNQKKNEIEVSEAPEKVLLLDSEREVKIFISSPFRDMNAGV